jgi:hypothetical protein
MSRSCTQEQHRQWLRNLALLLVGLLLYVGCSDDKEGLKVTYPQDTGIRWQYEILQFYEGDTTSLGTIDVHNAEVGQFQQRSDIMRTRLVRRLDSLAGTERDSTITETFYDFSNKFSFRMYAGSFYRIFDTMLSPTVLDTIEAQDPAGDPYQYFFEYEPGWIKFTSFEQNAATPYEIHAPETFYIDFRRRETRISGSVEINSSGVFWGFDTIDLPMQDSVDTYVIKNTMYFDYDLQRDTVAVQPFRETMDWWYWVHPTAGIVQRERSPFTLSVPGVPSRGALIHKPGERWELRDLKGITIPED